MFRTLPLLSKKFTSPTSLLGFTRYNLKSLKSPTPKEPNDHDLKLREFINTSLSSYPLNLILTNRMLTNSFYMNAMVGVIQSIHERNSREINPDKSQHLLDPNDSPLLIDYKVIDKKFSPSLHSIFKKMFSPVLEINDRESEILIISYTEEGLNSDISFLQDFRVQFNDFFEIKGCILNTQAFPFLRGIKKTRENSLSTNMYNIAKCGLVKVNKEENGSLILTYKIKEPIM